LIYLPETLSISIVDDDESVRTATANLVQSLGFRARAFASPEEFLQSAHISTTSCLVSDIQMPGMNGLDLQNLLIAQGHRIPIIFITAYPDETIRTRALDAGAVCFLGKPFDVQTLIESLHKAVNRQDRETT
jgi:FixJ family two-component response regulator